jgi:5-methylcytosine-specific restriction endonuclease McrA
MLPRPCQDCGTITSSTRCPRCQQSRDRTRNRERTHYRGDWPALSRKLRVEWIERCGYVCPGWHTPAHPATDLVVDHVQPRSRTQLAILCRTCNSRKSATERPARP